MNKTFTQFSSAWASILKWPIMLSIPTVPPLKQIEAIPNFIFLIPVVQVQHNRVANIPIYPRSF